MKKYLLLLFCVYLSSDTKTQGLSKVVTTVKDETLTDRDGNIYGFKIMPDNKLWLTDNLKVKTEEAYCYEDLQLNCDKYGRLYTWKSAQQGCKILGEGWRLPTEDDWRNMAKQYGGAYDQSTNDGKMAYKTLLSGGSSGLNILLGGGRDLAGKYARGNAHGFYWTATERDKDNAWFYNFGDGSHTLYRQNGGEKYQAFSVRCIKDLVLTSPQKP